MQLLLLWLKMYHFAAATVVVVADGDVARTVAIVYFLTVARALVAAATIIAAGTSAVAELLF